MSIDVIDLIGVSEGVSVTQIRERLRALGEERSRRSIRRKLNRLPSWKEWYATQLDDGSYRRQGRRVLYWKGKA